MSPSGGHRAIDGQPAMRSKRFIPADGGTRLTRHQLPFSAHAETESIEMRHISRAFAPVDPYVYSGIVTRPVSTLMRSSGRGESGMGGTFAASSGGAWPASPPRGVVRTTWLSGSGEPFVR